MTSLVINVPGEYISLGLVMQAALEQASKGKGRERHASEGEAYEDQIICEVARRVGLGYPLGQAVKKIYESQRIGGEKGRAELLGAINYIAAAVIVDREMDERDRALFAQEQARAERQRAKAEGVEELMVSPFDAPQTPDAVCRHIVDCNPATFHTPSYAEEQLEHHSRLQAHKPTGEELAEMAEEEAHG